MLNNFTTCDAEWFAVSLRKSRSPLAVGCSAWWVMIPLSAWFPWWQSRIPKNCCSPQSWREGCRCTALRTGAARTPEDDTCRAEQTSWTGWLRSVSVSYNYIHSVLMMSFSAHIGYFTAEHWKLFNTSSLREAFKRMRWWIVKGQWLTVGSDDHQWAYFSRGGLASEELVVERAVRWVELGL